tara:strand:+ start:195 stop:581 length:387 start_codon:yes stop_codon:yes gene_type:complete
MPKILDSRLLYRASHEREQANLHFEKSDRLKPITIIVFGLGIVFALLTYFVAAAALIFLCYGLAFIHSHNIKKGNQHWHRSRQLVRQARQQAQATREGIEAGENPAHRVMALSPLLNTTPGGSAGGSR